ncbi:1,4-beta-D-glucan glucohydrolase [Sphingorhabdus lutea]|uniref:1,4-beta-D-glucan glucohydrolase n=1 Tax=Sphingorhabdus lutea TaxID=1913578 RepID=A0A1L3JB14_9SPHN|nr:glycoside hydrolase family 3 protein [Sphingorhabdus lutea]APG62327.1 1,4-beta-D-glucan glucohydrolase [Sphingorhabdus lutea]
MRKKIILALLGSALLLPASTFGQSEINNQAPQQMGQANPQNWPIGNDPVPRNAKIERQIKKLLAKMSLEQKVGQIIQGDIDNTTPEDVYQYHLGSVLNGGNSAPGDKQWASAAEWLADADRYYDASMRRHGKLPHIPLTWGSDAVHGHNNVIGATLFPHNIGLGAMRNPELMRKIGEVTAMEMRVTGLDWTFAPTLAVVRDDRWGRAYEGYSENPNLVASYAGPLVEGIQGKIGDADWLKGAHIVATAKHFVGDGGTVDGKDQGDNISSEAVLRDQQAAGYMPAINAGIQSIMASYNSWHGEKMHGNKSLLTDVLRGRMKFGGFVVGDWNGHGQVAGCTPTNCAASFNAGLDMFMAPDSWKELYANILQDVKQGKISKARLDEAVGNVLRVKLRAGLFESGRPSSRPYAGQFDKIGSDEHRAIARQAVQESMVLLKNNDAVLPLKSGQKILVTGDGANNHMKQSGGWTLSWQGTGLSEAEFVGATTIGKAIMQASNNEAVISEDGEYKQKPDVAIVVFGEDPYAEFQGDVPDLMFRDKQDNLALLKKYQQEGIKTVSIFLSGRPLWVNEHINASDSFVAAWLPGSEGGGVADILFGKADFKGKLSFSWPKLANQYRLNVGDKDYDPLFPYDYGLSYKDRKNMSQLSINSGLAAGSDLPVGTWFERGKEGAGLSFSTIQGTKFEKLINGIGTNDTPLRSLAMDRHRQEDARRFIWSGKSPATLVLVGEGAYDLSRESNGAVAIEIDYRVNKIGDAPVNLISYNIGPQAAGNGIDISAMLKMPAPGEWKTMSVPLSCFEKQGLDMTKIAVPLGISTQGVLDISISRVALGSSANGLVKCQ